MTEVTGVTEVTEVKKKIKLFLLASVASVTFVTSVTSPLFAEKKFTPYYRFTFGEGISIPSKGDFFANQELDTKMGTSWAATDRIKVFGLYNLTYDGPGLIRAEGRLFTERAIRHAFLIEPSFMVNDSLGTVKTKIFIINEKRRSGTNEQWGEGLYDNKALGFSVGIAKELFGWQFEPSLSYTSMEFPNYTDLLRDFQTSGLTAELQGGLMDQDIIALQLGARHEHISLFAGYSIQDYEREHVIAPTGNFEGAKQKDTMTELKGSLDASLWRFTLVPTAALRLKRSNQNYLRFAFLGDTNPKFVEKNYDYNEYEVSSTLYMRLTSRKAVFGSVNLFDRTYNRRPPRDGQGNYLDGQKQHSILGSWGGGLRWMVSDYSTWSLSYNLVFSKSNMKFERFIPYNYTGHVLGLYFTVQP